MRYLALAAAAVAAVTLSAAAAAGAFNGDSHPRTHGTVPPSPTPSELATIRRIVLQSAARMGDPRPTDGVLVPTTRRRAELVDVDTAEADIPVYFVLVRGHFDGGTILTLTIDPSTKRSLDTGLVGAMPDVDAIGVPEPLPLSAGAELARSVPCPDGHQRLVGPQTLRRFHAVTAVSCIDGTRTYPGQGEWQVQIRRVAVGSVATLLRYFEQPDQPSLPKGAFCDDVLHSILVPTFVSGGGRWVVPRTPTDACGSAPGNGEAARQVHWRAVSVHKVRLMVSAAALAAHCAMGLKDLPAGGIGPLSPTSGGPLFRSTPQTARVCIYRTPPNDFEAGRFVRGFSLDASQTHKLLGAMTGAAPSGSCADERTFAVVDASDERWAEVELGGCWRVGRTYPDYGLGGADPAVVQAILGTR